MQPSVFGHNDSNVIFSSVSFSSGPHSELSFPCNSRGTLLPPPNVKLILWPDVNQFSDINIPQALVETFRNREGNSVHLGENECLGNFRAVTFDGERTARARCASLAWYRPRPYTVSRCPEQTLWQRRATDRLVLSWPSHLRIWQRAPAGASRRCAGRRRAPAVFSAAWRALRYSKSFRNRKKNRNPSASLSLQVAASLIVSVGKGRRERGFADKREHANERVSLTWNLDRARSRRGCCYKNNTISSWFFG